MHFLGSPLRTFTSLMSVGHVLMENLEDSPGSASCMPRRQQVNGSRYLCVPYGFLSEHAKKQTHVGIIINGGMLLALWFFCCMKEKAFVFLFCGLLMACISSGREEFIWKKIIFKKIIWKQIPLWLAFLKWEQKVSQSDRNFRAMTEKVTDSFWIISLLQLCKVVVSRETVKAVGTKIISRSHCATAGTMDFV